MKRFHFAAMAVACALSACGGGGGNSDTPRVSVSAVKVTGASLADSGTFGYKFTVQPKSQFQVYSERVASALGVSSLCNAYSTVNGTTFTGNAGCTNYAVAGASVGNYNFTYHMALGNTLPLSMIKQLTDLGTAGVAANDVILVGEGPANDVAQVATAYLGQSPANGTDYKTMMAATGLDSTTLDTMIASPSTKAQLGGLYMQKMADNLTASIRTNLLDRGATRVAVLNVLDVTLTPRFKSILAQLNAADPSGATATGFQTAVRAWVNAFNARLASNLAAYSDKVVIVDFNTSFTAEMSDPAQYGLTNVSATVCDEVVNHNGTTTTLTAGATSLAPETPTVAQNCTATAASAITPQHGAVNGTNWWKTYLFADNFHPTPYGHQLLAQLVAKRLTEAGWL